MTKTELYFGMSISSPNSDPLYYGRDIPGKNKVVSEGEFKAFLNYSVTPAFPDGLTMIQGYGQFKMANTYLANAYTVSESMAIVILIHDGTPVCDQAIDKIREQYKKMFSQESVMRVDHQVSVSF